MTSVPQAPVMSDSAPPLWLERSSPTLHQLAELGMEQLGATIVTIAFTAGEHLRFVGRCGAQQVPAMATGIALADSLCRIVIESGNTVDIADAARDPRSRGTAPVLTHGVGAYLGVPIRDADGATIGSIGAVQGTAREWTPADERLLMRLARIAETEVAAHRQAAEYAASLERQHEAEQELYLLRHAVARLNDMVIITEAEPLTQDGPKVVFVNEAFERLTGYTAEEVMGRTPRVLQGPESDRRVLDRIRTALREWRPIREEIVNYTKSGEKFWLELDIVPVADESGWYTHWIAVERDITERKRLEAELRQAQRMEAVGQFSGGIAHDFANIAAIIATSTALLADRVGDDPDLEAIRAAAERARALVGQILAFSRRQVLDVRAIPLPAFMHRTEPLLRRLVHEDIALDVQVADDAPAVLADETQLVQVLLNLVANASDAMPEGGHLRLDVARVQTAAGEMGRLSVEDSGAGIEQAHLPLVFEPFFTTKPQGKGTGLGLSTVYGIVRQLGGELRVSSEVGAGTRFEIDLPCASTEAARAPAAAAPATPTEPRDARLRGLRVLLVEDEAPLRRATQRLLQRCGIVVDVAVDGREALEVLRAATVPPDLVLTDLCMPNLGGRALADALHAVHPGIRILFMSGYDGSLATSTLGDLPIAGFIQKPFEIDALLDAIAAAAGPRRVEG